MGNSHILSTSSSKCCYLTSLSPLAPGMLHCWRLGVEIFSNPNINQIEQVGVTYFPCRIPKWTLPNKENNNSAEFV